MSSSHVARWPSGRLSPVEAVGRSLARIEQCEGGVHAWTHVDVDGARRSAVETQAAGAESRLDGLPIGIKDTIDVGGMPCERGSLAYQSRIPTRDAELVTRLRDAGATIVGKTVTTELAVVRPGATRNPWDLGHTPGGSSSGSAAAVAAGMVPVAIGTQTIGSTLRPASYCGVVGYKPSVGRLPLDGVLAMSPIVDSVGILAESVDIALAVMRVLDREPGGLGSDHDLSRSESTVFHATPWWGLADRVSVAAIDTTRARLESQGLGVSDAEPPSWFDDLLAAHWSIVRAGIADAARREPAGVQDLFGDEIREISQAYFDPSGETSAAATRALVGYRARIGELFADADYILTPCVTGEAPSGLAWTGDPIFCQPWSALGLPAISIPVGVGKNGLPVGIQIVGKLNRDYELLSFARDLASDTWYSCQLK